MKRHGKFNIEEMMNLAPFEFKLFYHMTIKDIKEEAQMREKFQRLQKQQQG